MTSRKFRAALTAGMVTLALLLGAGTAQAATVVTSDDGTNATGILGLEVGTTLYDVQFVRSTPQGLYSIPPGFDFANEGEATDANGVVITVLNTNPAVMTVGPSATPSNVYLIGYEFDEGGLGDPEFEVTEAKYQNGWEESLSSSQDINVFGIYASFTLSPLSTVPDVLGEDLSSAQQAIEAAELNVGEPTYKYSNEVAVDVVINQIPSPGLQVRSGTAVDLEISKGPVPGVQVPGVVEENLWDAEEAIVAAGLVVGKITKESSETVPNGQVISQDPAGGTSADLGSAVDLVVSTGLAPVEVPNVVEQTQADAEAAIEAAELNVGNVREKDSDTVPAGDVSSQNPAANTPVARGSAVDLVVSTGPLESGEVPNVVGQDLASAAEDLEAAGLSSGDVTTALSESVPLGFVISQDPVAGEVVTSGSPVALVISKGSAVTVTSDGGSNATGIEGIQVGGGLYDVAFVINSADAVYGPPELAIFDFESFDTSGTAAWAVDAVLTLDGIATVGPAGEGLPVYDIGFGVPEPVGIPVLAYQPNIGESSIWAKAPEDATETYFEVRRFADFTLLNPTSVPEVEGQVKASAEAEIRAAGLEPLSRSEVSQQVPAGTVIDQEPPAGREAAPGSEVNLLISAGPEAVEVPNVVGKSREDAEDTLDEASLTVGEVSEQNNEMPAGQVISQFPAAGTAVPRDSAVNLVVSLGPASGEVPNVVGQGLSEARDTILAAGLTVGEVSVQNSSAPLGQVISQDPAAGTIVDPGSAVDLVISLGPEPPAPVMVPNVVGQDQVSAEDAIVDAGLTVGNVIGETNSAPVGNVISQDPAAGTEVAPDSPVNLMTSTGPGQVAVPDVVGQDLTSAVTEIDAAGLTLGVPTQASHPTAPAGEVISQNPDAGTSVDPGSAVDLEISSGPAPVLVPNVVGLDLASAVDDIAAAGLIPGAVGGANHPTAPAGEVIDQDPDAGTSVAPGSGVNLVISKGPAPVAVPNVVGQTRPSALIEIFTDGLTVGNVTNRSSIVAFGFVISQNPTAGTEVAPGSGVDLEVSTGPAQVTVPNVVGQKQAVALVNIAAVSLTVGNITDENSSTVAFGFVISQNPTGGSSAAQGSPVDLVVSLGPPPQVTVPDVVELSQSDAEEAIDAAGLTVGNVTFENSSTVAFGFVISQNPTAGSSIDEGSPVDLIVSLGSGSANACPGGSIVGGTFDEIVITDFVDCTVVGVHVTGRVLVQGADQFTMTGSLVEGNIRVINVVSATIAYNKVDGGNLVAKGNAGSSVLRNIVLGGSIRVNDDTCIQQQDVEVLQNLVSGGNLRVNCNEKAKVSENKVTNGDITCRENLSLDSTDNIAEGGTVNCSDSLKQ